VTKKLRWLFLNGKTTGADGRDNNDFPGKIHESVLTVILGGEEIYILILDHGTEYMVMESWCRVVMHYSSKP
jgi:hypothetical protein